MWLKHFQERMLSEIAHLPFRTASTALTNAIGNLFPCPFHQVCRNIGQQQTFPDHNGCEAVPNGCEAVPSGYEAVPSGYQAVPQGGQRSPSWPADPTREPHSGFPGGEKMARAKGTGSWKEKYIFLEIWAMQTCG